MSSFSSPQLNPAASAADDVIFEQPGALRLYRSGRVDRLFPDNLVPPSLDPTTKVRSKDITINPTTNLSARLYLPPSVPKKLPILVSIHGGAFCIGRSSSAVYHRHLNALAARANVLSVSVDYRLAPEHPLPAAYDDCHEALEWVLSAADPWISEFGDPDKIYVAGESAGGNIVHNLGMRLGREGRKVEGLAMVHAFFWGEERIGNEGVDNWRGRMSKAEDVVRLWMAVCPGTTGLDDPRVNPAADGAPSLKGLGCRRVLVCVAELDLLRDRGRLYYERLRGSGWDGEAEFLESEGEDHCFYFGKVGSLKEEEFMGRLVGFLNKA